MKAFMPEISTFAHTLDGDKFYSHFFSGRINTTAIKYSIPEYVEGTTYAQGQKVKIGDLKIVFISGHDNNTSHPLKTDGHWWSEGENEVASLDQNASSYSIHPIGENAIEDFYTKGATHLVGIGIKGVEHVSIYKINGGDRTTGELIKRIDLMRIQSYKGCGTCCTNEVYSTKRFLIEIVDGDTECDVPNIRVVLKKHPDADSVTIGTLTTTGSVDMGCLLVGATYGIKSGEVVSEYTPLGKYRQEIPYIERTINGSVLASDGLAEQLFSTFDNKIGNMGFFKIESRDNIVRGGSDFSHTVMMGVIHELTAEVNETEETKIKLDISSIEIK